MTDLGTTSLHYSARPAISLDGDRDEGLEDGLMTLLVEDSVEGMVRLEACFGNWGTSGGDVGFLYFERDILEFGRELTVEMGAGGAAGQVFSGRIMALEGRFPQSRPPELTVLAEDRFQDLRMTRRSRTFLDASFEDIASAIASDHGLGSEIDVDSPTFPALAQLNQSDLAFLRQVAREIDAEVWVQDTTLFAQARSRRSAEEVALTYGQGLKELQITADLADQRTKLVVGGYDVAAKDGIEAVAEAGLLSGENQGETGPAVLEAAIGARTDIVAHFQPATREIAQAQAQATFRRNARRFLSGEGVAEGNARIKVGSSVRLRGCGKLFDGVYAVVRTRHLFDLAGGFRTEFRVERPWIGT